MLHKLIFSPRRLLPAGVAQTLVSVCMGLGGPRNWMKTHASRRRHTRICGWVFDAAASRLLPVPGVSTLFGCGSRPLCVLLLPFFLHCLSVPPSPSPSPHFLCRA